jgi:hypothetical protein
MNHEKNIITQIETYIQQGGGEYGDWFVGLADNPIDPVTEAFRLNKVQHRRFTYIETASQQAARFVSDYFLKVRGTDGDLSDIDTARPCQSIYVYKKADNLIASESAA